ncbi:uncharacterized protein LOC128988631 [Macrosteles quadrilineatus]|uniref:uncharacterized protein LOC128988631 n=1 Tax=Macrosteles quadrilineatus TaxID=74068 RepID=UPI0023E28F12|nr:uncharacterized protein LOC128988631 [Macrosteles quadrilineatus]
MEDFTQVIDISATGIDISDLGRVKVGILRVDGRSHDIYKGENVIGRDELSDIVLRHNSISSRHAVVEVEDWDTHLLFDCGSTNKTRLGTIFLKPNVRYNLQGGEVIMFANIRAEYCKLTRPKAEQNEEDSASDAGSESLLDSVPADLDADIEIEKALPTCKEIHGNESCNGNDNSDLNESSLLEENKNKPSSSRIEVIEDSDDSTEDELDFIPPSQTVKEFVAKKQADSKRKHINNISEDIFSMADTQDQDMFFMTEKLDCNKIAISPDQNTQNLFSSEIQQPPKIEDQTIFEAETQGCVLNEEKLLEINPVISTEIFDADTEMVTPHIDENVQMSDLILSNTSSESLNKGPQINLVKYIKFEKLEAESEGKSLSKSHKSISPTESDNNVELEDDIYNACTQVNTSLQTTSIVNPGVKQEVCTKSEPVDDENLLEETQLNLNLIENHIPGQKQRISRHRYTNEASDHKNFESEETQINVQLYSFVNESKTSAEEETNSRHDRTSREANIDKGDEIENDCRPIQMQSDPDKIILGSQVEKDIVNPHAIRNMSSGNNPDLDESSNQSDSLLALVPLEQLEQEAQQALSCEDPQSDKRIDNQPKQAVSDESSNKNKDDVMTLGDMDICSTVGNGTNVSTFGSSRKLLNDSTVKGQHLPNVSKALNHSIIFDEPCGSSTPFRIEAVPNNKKSSRNVIVKTPPRRIVSVIESPDLPCTEDLAKVANNTPERHCLFPTTDQHKQLDDLPLALNKTPRVRKVSKKVAESLEGEQVSCSKPPKLPRKDKNMNKNEDKTISSTKKGDPEEIGRNHKCEKNNHKKSVEKKRLSNDIADKQSFKSNMLENKVKLHIPLKRLSVEINYEDTTRNSNKSDIDDQSPAKRSKNTKLIEKGVEDQAEKAVSDVSKQKPISNDQQINNTLEIKESPIQKVIKTACKNYKNKREESKNNLTKRKSVIKPILENENQVTLSNEAERSTRNSDVSLLHSKKNDTDSNGSVSVDVPSKDLAQSKETKLDQLELDNKKTKNKLNSKLTNTQSKELSNVKMLTVRRSSRGRRKVTSSEKNEDTSSVSNSSAKKPEQEQNHSGITKKDDMEHMMPVEKSKHSEQAPVLSSNKDKVKTRNSCTSVGVVSNVVENTSLSNKELVVNIDSIHSSLKKRKMIAKKKEVINRSSTKPPDTGTAEPNIRKSNRRMKDKADSLKQSVSKIECKENKQMSNKIEPSAEINARKSSQKKDESSREETTSNISSSETNNKGIKKKRLQVDSVEDTTKTKLTGKNKNNDILENLNASKGYKEKLTSHRISGRPKVKPARFRDKNEDNSSLSSSDRGLSPNKKSKKMQDTTVFESVMSDPSNSTMNHGKKHSEVFKTPVVGGERTTSNTTKNKKSRSRSRSDSSQSSMRSDPPSSLHSPRRSGTKGKKVLFTSGLMNSAWESQVKKLGGSVVECPIDCSLLVADKVRRTVKFLCVLGQGKPIVSPDWINQSWRCTSFIEPSDYLLVDAEAEEKFKFSLSHTFQAAKNQQLLTGYHVHATPKVKPPPEDIKSIVECCGGKYMENIPSKWPENSVILSHVDDKYLWKKFKVKGETPPIVAAEMLLIGVLQHKIEIDPHRL